MDIANIIYYTRVDGTGKTVSLRDMCLREPFELEDIFYAVKEATDEKDLLCRIRRISCDQIDHDNTTPSYIRFVVTDACGNKNYLKFKIRKEQ
jgi:hypothetical protein